MRASTEALQHTMERGGGAVTLDDGVRVICDTAWLQLLPDADEPIFHVYAEGALREDSEKLANSLAGLVRAVIHRHSR